MMSADREKKAVPAGSLSTGQPEAEEDESRAEKEVLELTRYILHKHYCENDPEAIISLMDEDLHWLGAGEGEWAVGREVVADIFRQFAGQVPRCNLSGENLRVLALAPQVWLCCGRLWIATDASTGIGLRAHQRVSLIFRRRGGRLLCCHIHISNPYQEMREGDVGFPAQVARQSYLYMQEMLDAQRRQIEEQTALLERMSYEDSLTGLYNRNKFSQMAQSLPEEFERGGVACFDLNSLKEVNDQLGHSAGDVLISQAARQLEQVFGKNVYRTGGDEFVVVDTEQDEESFRAAAALARQKMEERKISCSVGVSWRSGRATLKEQYDEADRQMYRQKRQFYQLRAHDRRGRQ